MECDCHRRLGPGPEYPMSFAERDAIVARIFEQIKIKMEESMPHDIKGNPLNIGDEVILRGKIKSINPGEEFCNCTIEVPPMFPRTEPESMSAINTRQLEKVG